MKKFTAPPCNVGDTIYTLDLENRYQINEEVVLQFEVDDDGFDTFTKDAIYGQGMWGLTLFLTREKAEQAKSLYEIIGGTR